VPTRSTLFALLFALGLLIAPAAFGAAPSRAFFGVVAQESPAAADLDRMRGVVGSLRVPAYWFQLEPRRGQYEFGPLDEVVGAAARRGIRVLPFVYGSPSWLRAVPARPPHTNAPGRAAWAALMRVLVRRYGPGGAFWQDRPARLPIRRWQIWNEPNFVLFWRPRPSAAGYIRLLRIAAGAIRGEDPGARVIAAGVAPVTRGMAPVGFLKRMYRRRGARAAFDVAALHPYATGVRHVATYVRRARRAMTGAGDGAKPLRITELGVASDGLRRSPYDKGAEGQAIYLFDAYRLLLSRRDRWRIGGVDWFSWRDTAGDDPYCVFCQYSGLFDAGGSPKPAWRAMRAVSANVR
jgi:hypothetical protein